MWAGSIRSARVLEVLARLVSLHGAPRYLRSDIGPECVSRAVLRWITAEGIDTAFIDPGKPWQNGTDESFNAKFRDECLKWSGSARGRRPLFSSSSGADTTTRSVHTRAWAT